MVEEDSQLHVQWSPRRHHSSVYFQVYILHLILKAHSDIMFCCLSLMALYVCVGLYVGHGRSGS